VDVDTQYTAITHLYKHVCPHTALVTMTLVLEGVQVYVCHVLYALYNKHQALLSYIITGSTLRQKKVCFDDTNKYKEHGLEIRPLIPL